jgi:SulP family sulfate permease
MQDRLEPKLVTVLREGYSRRQFGRDAAAGVVVGILALPLAIAFAIASGVKPEQGLATAIVGGFLISLLGGSRVQIGGPTGAFVVLVYEIVHRHGLDGLALATLMAGLLLVVMGFARLGTVIKFVPYPVTVGFTAGIALIIAGTQVQDLLGLTLDAAPAAGFGRRMVAYGTHLESWNPWALGIGVFAAATVAWWPRITRRVPGALVAVVVASVLAHVFHWPVETIADRFGAVPSHLPTPSIPTIDLSRLAELSPAALSIALLAAIESLLSAVVADGMAGTRHRSNMELVAQGAANLVVPLFGGIPATGAIARTATNVRNGGRTPVAGLVHAVTLLLILRFFGKWAGLVPLAALAGVLLVIAYNMSEWRLFLRLFRSPRSDILVLVVTFLLTVLVDLTVALQVGVVLAAFLFMRRMAAISESGYVRGMLGEDEEQPEERALLDSLEIPPGVDIFRVSGSLFFGAASKFRDEIRRVDRKPTVLILRLRDVPAIDASGLHALEDVVDSAARDGTRILLTGVHAQPRRAMKRAGLLDRLGPDAICPDLHEALGRARALLPGPQGTE